MNCLNRLEGKSVKDEIMESSSPGGPEIALPAVIAETAKLTGYSRSGKTLKGTFSRRGKLSFLRNRHTERAVQLATGSSGK